MRSTRYGVQSMKVHERFVIFVDKVDEESAVVRIENQSAGRLLGTYFVGVWSPELRIAIKPSSLTVTQLESQSRSSAPE